MGGEWPVLSIHDEKTSNEHNWVLNFQTWREVPILIGPDRIFRGLDLEDVKFSSIMTT